MSFGEEERNVTCERKTQWCKWKPNYISTDGWALEIYRDKDSAILGRHRKVSLDMRTMEVGRKVGSVEISLSFAPVEGQEEERVWHFKLGSAKEATAWQDFLEKKIDMHSYSRLKSDLTRGNIKFATPYFAELMSLVTQRRQQRIDMALDSAFDGSKEGGCTLAKILQSAKTALDAFAVVVADCFTEHRSSTSSKVLAHTKSHTLSYGAALHTRLEMELSFFLGEPGVAKGQLRIIENTGLFSLLDLIGTVKGLRSQGGQNFLPVAKGIADILKLLDLQLYTSILTMRGKVEMDNFFDKFLSSPGSISVDKAVDVMQWQVDESSVPSDLMMEADVVEAVLTAQGEVFRDRIAGVQLPTEGKQFAYVKQCGLCERKAVKLFDALDEKYTFGVKRGLVSGACQRSAKCVIRHLTSSGLSPMLRKVFMDKAWFNAKKDDWMSCTSVTALVDATSKWTDRLACELTPRMRPRLFAYSARAMATLYFSAMAEKFGSKVAFPPAGCAQVLTDINQMKGWMAMKLGPAAPYLDAHAFLTLVGRVIVAPQEAALAFGEVGMCHFGTHYQIHLYDLIRSLLVMLETPSLSKTSKEMLAICALVPVATEDIYPNFDKLNRVAFDRDMSCLLEELFPMAGKEHLLGSTWTGGKVKWTLEKPPQKGGAAIGSRAHDVAVLICGTIEKVVECSMEHVKEASAAYEASIAKNRTMMDDKEDAAAVQAEKDREEEAQTAEREMEKAALQSDEQQTRKTKRASCMNPFGVDEDGAANTNPFADDEAEGADEADAATDADSDSDAVGDGTPSYTPTPASIANVKMPPASPPPPPPPLPPASGNDDADDDNDGDGDGDDDVSPLAPAAEPASEPATVPKHGRPSMPPPKNPPPAAPGSTAESAAATAAAAEQESQKTEAEAVAARVAEETSAAAERDRLKKEMRLEYEHGARLEKQRKDREAAAAAAAAAPPKGKAVSQTLDAEPVARRAPPPMAPPPMAPPPMAPNDDDSDDDEE
jgi:hypothetical protein